MEGSMSAHPRPPGPPASGDLPPQGDIGVIRKLLPYLWEFRGRVFLALAFLVAAKLANIAVPMVMKRIVDDLSGPRAALAVPVALLAAYALLRLSSRLFNELRDVVFVKVSQRAMRRVALQVFHHLHGLSLRFHLERQTGGLTRDIERGTRGISTLLSFMVFSVLPTLLEITLVTGFLIARFDVWFGVITVAALLVYVGLTFSISEWRTRHRRRMNEMDSRANTKAVDSLLNYETVKYFGNEDYEARRYDANLQGYEQAVVTSEASLGLLNTVQAIVIATAVALLMWRAAEGIVAGALTLGDLVMVNALLIQLYIPLNFLGVMYREMKQALVDMEKMFRLLGENREVQDRAGARPLAVAGGAIRFEHVDFGYDPRRPILADVSFEVPAGRKVAVVGASGSGKSTIARLLFRFYDAGAGRITIDGQDIREVTQASLRAAIGVVPQDTVLFNDTIYYNVAYGRPEATREEVEEAARVAHIAEFIERLPLKWETTGGRARPEALGGREAARVDRAHPPQGPAHPRPRRGHLGAGLAHREGDPGRARGHLARPHHARDRPPPLDHRRRRGDPRARPRPHHRARRLPRPAARRGALRRDVAPAARGRARGRRRLAASRRRLTYARNARRAAKVASGASAIIAWPASRAARRAPGIARRHRLARPGRGHLVAPPRHDQRGHGERLERAGRRAPGVAGGEVAVQHPGAGAAVEPAGRARQPGAGNGTRAEPGAARVSPDRLHVERLRRIVGGGGEEGLPHRHRHARAEQGEAGDARAVPEGRLQRHQAAHAVPHERGLREPGRVEECHDPARQGLDRLARRARAAAVGGQVRGEHAAAVMREIARLPLPHAVVEGRAVDEHHRGPRGIERRAPGVRVGGIALDDEAHQGRPAARRPRARSSSRSSGCSSPTDRRTVPGVMPAAASAASSMR